MNIYSRIAITTSFFKAIYPELSYSKDPNKSVYLILITLDSCIFFVGSENKKSSSLNNDKKLCLTGFKIIDFVFDSPRNNIQSFTAIIKYQSDFLNTFPGRICGILNI